jgi:potassium-transporting ATPase KdpC subunit
MSILREIRPAVSLVVLFTLFTGFILPEAFTGVMQVALPSQANGSLITENGQVAGSALIGQNFTSPKYFQPRPSALTGTDAKGNSIPTPYDASESGASNLAPTSAALLTSIKQRVAAYTKAFGPGPVPADAVTSSGSGLDPDISLDNALRQAAAVAAARKLPADTVINLVNQMTHHAFLGIVGTDHLNVLELNLALDQLPAAQ